MSAAAEARVAGLIRALRASGQPVQLDLARRLMRCQQARIDRRAGHVVDWRPMCRHAACEVCRRTLEKRAADRVRRRFRDADLACCHEATIMLARTGSLQAVRDLVRVTRTELRNMRDRRGRADPRWRNVMAAGAIEVDAMGPDDVGLLPPQRRAVVRDLPMHGALDHATYGHEVLWIAHAHLALSAPELSQAELQDALLTQWPGIGGRVRVQPFWDSVPAGDSAARIVGYASKHAMRLKLDGGDACTVLPWPAPVQATFWGWVHSMRNGLASLRLQIGGISKTGRFAQ